MVQTAKRRQLDLENTASLFHAHLVTVSGTTLAPNVRLGVAICARRALFCKGCDGLPPETCLLKSARFSSVCTDMNHGDGEDCDNMKTWDETAFPTDSVSVETGKTLTSIVHAIVRHQGRLDPRWYRDSIDAIGLLGIVTQDCDDDNLTALRAAFCEVAILSSLSHAIHVMFLAMGREVPPLPTWEDIKGTPGPSNIHFPSLLRRVRQDAVATAPFFGGQDVKTGSPEFMKLSLEARANIKEWAPPYPMVAMLPTACLGFSPEDAVLLCKFKDITYLSMKEFFRVLNKFDPDRRCPSFTRFDAEIVATSVSEGHNCGF